MRIKLILASASPYRQKILESMGVPYEVLPTHTKEERSHAKGPKELVLRNARLKINWVLERDPEAFVLALDTVLVGEDGEVFNKPKDLSDSREMLRRMSGKKIDVCTGVWLRHIPSDIAVKYCEITELEMLSFDDAVIERYFSLIDPLKTSGGIEIEAALGILVKRYKGSKNNCIGLPKKSLAKVFKEIAWPTVVEKG